MMALVNRGANRIAIEALQVGADDTVLELGFGPGHAVELLTSIVSGGRVLGIDHSAAMLAQASRRNRAAIGAGRLALREGRFDSLPWPARSVDRILAVNVVYFFGSSGAEFREARRVLRPGGRIAIFAAHRRAMSRWRFSGPETHRTFDEADLMRFLVRGGFSEREIRLSSMMMPFGIPALVGTADKPIG